LIHVLDAVLGGVEAALLVLLRDAHLPRHRGGVAWGESGVPHGVREAALLVLETRTAIRQLRANRKSCVPTAPHLPAVTRTHEYTSIHTVQRSVSGHCAAP
jgi:hypothetical protein